MSIRILEVKHSITDLNWLDFRVLRAPDFQAYNTFLD
jgi:hypothetical protein